MSESQNEPPVKPRTLYEKILNLHSVKETNDTILLYIDRHLVYEVTSPQAFEGLRNARRSVRKPECTLATVDHNIPTRSRAKYQNFARFIKDAGSRNQCLTLENNVKDFNITFFGLGDPRQGIVHVIGPEQGFTLPGATIVCGDSHTSTHGAFGALAFGIGTSEVEHVLATQTLITTRKKNMKIQVDGDLHCGVTSKDLILYIIGQIGTAGGVGHVIEYCGSTIRSLSMEARMSICNMTIEAGATAGIIAPDEKTFEYLRGRPLAPNPYSPQWAQACEHWRTLQTDKGALFEKQIHLCAADVPPTITWGTSPHDTVAITGVVPNPNDFDDDSKRDSCKRALEYMGLTPGTPVQDLLFDKVFIGSCTNSRLEDLRAAANIVKGRHIAPNIKSAIVVPGSGLVKRQAEDEGLSLVFRNAGFEWREAGCSMCLGMNPDMLSAKERCASTSNRNFEGRQGAGGRTHLMSPMMAAMCAIAGRPIDIRPIVSAAQPSAGANTDEFARTNGDASQGSPSGTIHDFINEPVVEIQTEPTPAPFQLDRTFIKLNGIAAPMDRPNIDTDAIIPKQFLKTVKRSGLGSALFHQWRYDPETERENPDFILNKEPYRCAKILVVTGENFGCGSSREHAPWALLDFGLRCIIAPSFGAIFEANVYNNGMLPVKVRGPALERIAAEARHGRELEIDLPRQVVLSADGKELCQFEIPKFEKHCLVNGLDNISLTMKSEAQILDFEKKKSALFPWLDGIPKDHKLRGDRLQTRSSQGRNDKSEKESLTW